MTRPSLCANIILARLIQRLKGLLGSFIKYCVSRVESCRLLPAKSNIEICEIIQGKLPTHSTYGRDLTKLVNHLPRRGRKSKQTSRPEFARQCLRNELQLYSIRTKAAQNFIYQHDHHLIGATRSVNELRNILLLTNAFSNRLQIWSGDHAIRNSSGLSGESLSGELDCDKFIANLQDLFRRLQQNALEAFICHYLNIVEAHVLRWHLHWRHSKRIGEEWFAEWPNSQRPLSTTWPWNIKPSLLVLWGVCWMFYGPSGNDIKRPTRNPRGAAQSGDTLRTGHLGNRDNQSQPQQQDNSSEAWAGPASNSANTTFPNYSWLHPSQANASRRANNNNNNDPTQPGNTLPVSYATSVPSYPYISAPSSSSHLYPTSPVTWPYCQGINPASTPAYAPSYPSWQSQSPYDPTSSVGTTLQHTDRSNIVQPYAQRIRTSNLANPQAAAGTLGSLGFGLGLHMRDMQDYPSPGSSTSEQTPSPYVPVLPSNVLSPRMSLIPSPSVASITSSRQSSRRSQEPPRNAEGLLYCNHPEHAEQESPVFSRKCEWKKHMDKHERPFVCHEPECDNIRGFTYSGGLLRHQREVHRQHGGPKASCMCPYPDCKRHVGVGFSRKENLAEHLRRVHRDAGTDQTQREGPETAQNTTPGTLGARRKRRRTVPDDESGDEKDLEQEVKKLKRELQEKDERLEKLERQVQILMRGQK